MDNTIREIIDPMRCARPPGYDILHVITMLMAHLGKW